MYLAKTKTETVDKNTSIEASDFGGWQALNVGTTIAIVNGTPLDPNGATVGVDFTNLHPSVIWSEPIRITFKGTGTNSVILTRIKYTKK